MKKQQHLNLIVHGKFSYKIFCKFSFVFSTEEMPQSWIKVNDKYVPKQQSTTKVNPFNPNVIIPSDNTNIDRITDQVKKHAAINYSYYKRTK